MSTITQVLVVERRVASVVTAGVQGPPGGEDVPYARRTDIVSASISYRGEAPPGSSTADSVWRIRRITISGDTSLEEWADGDARFDNAWDDRASLTYA